jgi:ArsR family transcriptional regulator
MRQCAYKNLQGVSVIVELFKSLSDETRLRILGILLTGEMCVCEIEACLGLSQSNASRHLTTLKQAGILSSRKCSQWTYYKLNEEFYADNGQLIDYLSVKLKTLPGFAHDSEKAAACKNDQLCD